MCLFVIALTSMLVVAMLDSQTSQLAAVRNATDFEKALYLAGAGVHHALAELETDISWRGTVSQGSYPASGSYSATATNGAGDQITVTASGVSGGITRSLQITVSPGS
jgi:type II secretory pathway component PulK